MPCISYVLRSGDNLYRIAQTYKTTVNKIMNDNPHLDPYRLHIGDTIQVCFEHTHTTPTPTPLFDPSQPFFSDNPPYIELSNAMREAWEQHVYWTRLLIIGIIDNLADVEVTTQRLLRNPKDIADIYRPYYGDAAANTIETLLTEHLSIGKELVTALKEGNSTVANAANTKWYANADDIANALSSINPYYNNNMAKNMLYSHLDLTKQEVSSRMAGDYPADVSTMNQIEAQALEMADALTAGIVRQFPN